MKLLIFNKESVDLLLKEMNSTPSKLLPIDKHSHLQLQPQSSSASIFNSPTKPLNFPRTNSKPSLDPNSSSDTYTSEQDQEKGKEEKRTQPFKHLLIEILILIIQSIYNKQFNISNNSHNNNNNNSTNRQ